MPALRVSDPSAIAVLRRHWGRCATVVRVSTGVSRSTWRSGGFWLSHSDRAEEGRFLREALLLEALAGVLARERAAWRVPELVLTLAGERTAVTREGVWRLTRHLPGAELDMSDAASYPLLARLLAEVHGVLESVAPALAVCERGAAEAAPELVRAYTSSFRPATKNAIELQVVSAVAGWLAPRLPAFARLPRQLTHGDWTPRNIQLNGESWGVLDWEFARVDPAVLDLGQSASTILMWSGLASPGAHIEHLVERYAAHSGRAVSIESVHVAMALYWLQNYAHWRERQASAGGFEAVLAIQPERLLAVGEFVGAL